MSGLIRRDECQSLIVHICRRLSERRDKCCLRGRIGERWMLLE